MAKKTPQGQAAFRYYNARAGELSIDSQEFRTLLLRQDVPKASRSLPIDGLCENIEWRAEPGDPVLQGTVTMRMPDAGGPVKIHEGHVLKLDVRWGGVWREVWRMGMYDEAKTIGGDRTYQLFDDGRRLQESEDIWHFTKSKKKGKPKGWLCHEVLREVARRYKIKLGKVAKGTHYITDISGKMSPMAVIQRAYAIERRATGKRFVIRWQNGKLNVLPMRRNPLLYVLGPMIEAVEIGKEERDEQFATAVTVRATGKKAKGRKRQKIVYRHLDKPAIAKEGFVHKILDGGDVKDLADARRKAKRYLLRHSRRKRTITSLQHRGIAFIRRGDAIHVSLPEQGFTGRLGIAFVSSGSWTLSGGDFTMSLDLTIDDPFKTSKKKRKDKDKKTRDKKRAERAK